MIFGINTTCDISKFSQISRAVRRVKLRTITIFKKISLVVFMPIITTNHAITYTEGCLSVCPECGWTSYFKSPVTLNKFMKIYRKNSLAKFESIETFKVFVHVTGRKISCMVGNLQSVVYFSVSNSALGTSSSICPGKALVAVTLQKEKSITCDLMLSMVFCWDWKKRM